MAALDFSDGAMVALYPRETEANALALEAGQPADDLHVTLIYLGTVREALPLIELVQAVAGGVASETEALSGEVGGVAQFEDSGQGAPLVLLPDVPGLTELGTKLRDELGRIGVESPSEHGFNPHLTLAYGDDAAAAADRIGAPLHFDYLCVVVGNDRFEYELQSPPQSLLADADHPSRSLPSAEMGELDELAQRAGLTASTADSSADAETAAALADDPLGLLKTLVAALPGDHNERAWERMEAPTTNASQLRWEAVLMIEGVATDDGRMIETGATDWRDLPLSLMAMVETGPGGHVGAFLVGRIDRVWRDGNRIMGSGVFDESDPGREVARLVSEQMLRGVSVDLSIRSFELRPRDDSTEQDAELDPIDLLLGETEMLYVVTDASIGMATVCPFPAFADAEIALVAAAPMAWRSTRQSGMTITEVEAPAPGEPSAATAEENRAQIITASAAGLAPIVPPADWFENPNLDEPTPLTITEDGRIYGHAAVWDVCHIGFEDTCVLAPRSRSGYRYFHLGEIAVELSTGEKLAIPCGQVTMGTGHAGLRLSRAAAVDHYDDTGTVAGHVVSGDDEHGIWFAGAVDPDLSETEVRKLRAAKISGDWRGVGGGLELVAMLAVNVPGFPVPRVRVASIAPEPVAEALVAAGIADRRVLDAMRERADAEDEIADLALRADVADFDERRPEGEPEPSPDETPALPRPRDEAMTVLLEALAASNEEKRAMQTAMGEALLHMSRKPHAPVPNVETHVHLPKHDLSVEVGGATVEIPEQPAPQVDVHVEPEIKVESPDVRVEVQPPPTRSIRVEEDPDGTKRYVPEEVEV